MTRARLLWITTFGLGYCRPFPGTWGSLPTAALAGVLIATGISPAGHPGIYVGVMLTLAGLFSWACLAQADAAEARFGKKDPGHVVADETAGQAIALVWIPPAALSTGMHAALMVVAGFVLFRIMDIMKPWPIRGLQKIPGGPGILVDDLLAGVLAGVGVQLVGRWMA